MLPFAAFPQTSDISVETIAKVKQAVFPIACVADKVIEAGKPAVKSKNHVGTGFFISEQGHIVTATHVLKSQPPEMVSSCRFEAVLPTVSGKSVNDLAISFPLMECKQKQDVDVSVCRLGKSPFNDPLLAGRLRILNLRIPENDVDGLKVAITGFPAMFGFPFSSVSRIASVLEKPRVLVVDSIAWPGVSGSPLYDADGLVIGVVTGRVNSLVFSEGGALGPMAVVSVRDFSQLLLGTGVTAAPRSPKLP